MNNERDFVIVANTYRGDCVRKVVLLCVMSCLLVACGIDEERYDDYEMIDIHEPYDERAVIEQMMDEQRDLLKPGFITKITDSSGNDFEFRHGEITYNSDTDELIYEADYLYQKMSFLLQFTAHKNSEEDIFEEELKQMEEVEPLHIPHADGYMGSKTGGRDLYHTFVAQTDDTDYNFSRNHLDMEQDDVEVVRAIGESLKTEEEGAYTPFYERFTLDPSTLHFPMLHKDFVHHVEVTIGDIGDYEPTNDIFMTYYVGEDDKSFTYQIRNEGRFAYSDIYIEEERFETENGLTVTMYVDEKAGNDVFVWEHEDIAYAMMIDPTEGLFTDEELEAIIDSSIDDSREFSSDDIFEPINDEPKLSDKDQEALTQLEKIADDIQRERFGE